MNPKTYVSIFLVFILVTAALWGYLNSIEDDYVAPARVRSGILSDPDFDESSHEARLASRLSAEGHRPGASMGREVSAAATVAVKLLDQLASDMDDRALRLRSNLRNKPITHLASGAFDAQAPYRYRYGAT